jgi:hypothetical protein
MLRDPLRIYLEEIESAVHALEEVYIEFYEEELLTPERVNLRIRIRFYTGCLLEINESVIYLLSHITSMDQRKWLIPRDPASLKS